jgi:hypothetical protein
MAISDIKSSIDSSASFSNDQDLIEAIKRNTELAKGKLLSLAKSQDLELADFLEKQYIPLLEADINTLTSASLNPKQYVILVTKAFLIFYYHYVDLFVKRIDQYKDDPSFRINPIIFSAVSLYVSLLYLPYVNGQQKKFILDVLDRKRQMIVQR